MGKTGAPIVPVSIVNAFSSFPPNALLPIRPAANMEMHFHPPISSVGRTEAELEDLVRLAIGSKLPPDHLPLEPVVPAESASAEGTVAAAKLVPKSSQVTA